MSLSNLLVNRGFTEGMAAWGDSQEPEKLLSANSNRVSYFSLASVELSRVDSQPDFKLESASAQEPVPSMHRSLRRDHNPE
jgi:hypothetical protein